MMDLKKLDFLEREVGKRHSLWEMDQLMRTISAERDGEEKRRGLKVCCKAGDWMWPIADS